MRILSQEVILIEDFSTFHCGASLTYILKKCICFFWRLKKQHFLIKTHFFFDKLTAVSDFEFYVFWLRDDKFILSTHDRVFNLR